MYRLGEKSRGAAEYSRCFRERYQHGQQWQKRGLEGRIHFGLMLADLVVLLTIVVFAVGFLVGWIYQWSDGT